MNWGEGGGETNATTAAFNSTFHNLPSTKSSALHFYQGLWKSVCLRVTPLLCWMSGNRLDTQSCLWLGPGGFASSNRYLECSIPKEAKLHLCDLETSQGPNRGARRGKQCPPVALWTGNEAADQARTQKAASAFNWTGGAGGYAPLIRGTFKRNT